MESLGSDASIEQLLNASGANMGGTVDYTPELTMFLIACGAISVVLGILNLIGRWLTINKCGGHGWAAIIPFYSDYEMASSNGCSQALSVCALVLPLVLVILRCIPSNDLFLGLLYIAVCIATLVVICIVNYNVAKNFGKGVGFTIGLILFPFIFFMVLGCGSAQPIAQKQQAL